MIDYIKRISHKQILFFLLIVLVIEFFLLKDIPFFWDAISKSVRADWIYNSDFLQIIVPTEINSGHPPLWVLSLAVFWTVFQKALWSSRLLLLLVNIGVIWQIVLLCKRNFIKTVAAFAVLFVCLEPTFVAQTTSLNNDMLLLFFTVLALNSLIKSKSFLFTLATTGLLLTNLRGIYLVAAISIIHLAYVQLKLIKNTKFIYFGYLVSIVSFAVFCFFQNEKLGWFIISQNENYNAHRQSVGIEQVIINIIVFFKSFLGYGRFIIVLFLLPLVVKYLKDKKNKSTQIDRMLIAYFTFALVFFIGVIPFSNPLGDRYFMICYLLSIILVINLLNFYWVKKKSIMYMAIFLFFISGHFWIYPATLSQPWDSSLAYLNYYRIEQKMRNYIDSIGINVTDIGTRVRFNDRAYSEFKPLKKKDLYTEFNIETNKFILLSNIENYTKDDELNDVMSNWKLVKSYSQLGVFLSLYKKE